MLLLSNLVFLAALQAAGPPALSLTPVRYELDLVLDYDEGSLHGQVALTVRNVSEKPVSEVPLLLHRLMEIATLRYADGTPIAFEQDVVRWSGHERRQVTAVRIDLPHPVAAGAETTLLFEYGGYLTPYTEVGWLYVRDHIAADFSIVRPDALAYPVVGYPSYEVNRAAGPAAFDYRARVTVPDGKHVANGGRLVGIERLADGRSAFTYENLKRAWRMDFAVADYGTLEGDRVSVYYLPGDSVGAAGVLEAAEESIRAYSDWFGPLADAGRFAVIEIPDGWGSQADVTSILQTAAAFQDSTRYNEIYHETAHLWHVTGAEPSPRWEEGLATYLGYLLQDRLDGRLVLEERLRAWRIRYREEVDEGSEVGSVPMTDYGAQGMTGHSYRVGALMFAELHGLVGDEAFGRIVGGYYRDQGGRPGTSEAFARFADSVTPEDLEPFFRTWLFTTGWTQLLDPSS